uniref:hypothetical protein n=1 Tax=Marinobacterium profundum TaxID=1714300 RepID=UPI000AE82148|nr:hypothetical protein [Marinobacterium profundum]
MKHLLLMSALALQSVLSMAAQEDTAVIERGRYLVGVGGCNDCHTTGYAEIGEVMPESERLLGSGVGFAGPWGVSYPANLRLKVAQLQPEQWRQRIRAGGMPPMTWPSLQLMTPEDQQAVYQYLRSLGPAGMDAPASVLPGRPIPTPYILLEPLPPTEGAVMATAETHRDRGGSDKNDEN